MRENLLATGVIVICLFFFLTACSATVEPPAPVEINISTSPGLSGLAQNLGEAFINSRSHISINIIEANATQSLAQLAAGDVDVIIVSNLSPGAEQFSQTPIARDGLAIIAHPDNPLKNLSLLELQDIFSGKVFNWRDAQGNAGEIQVAVRERGSGNRALFEDLAMDGRRITPNARLFPNGRAALEFVAQNPGAIGYVDTVYLTDAVKTLSIEEIFPTPENLGNGAYPLAHHLYVVTLPAPTPIVEEFASFLQRPVGQLSIINYQLTINNQPINQSTNQPITNNQ